MCKIVEDYANEVSKGNIKNLFENGCPLDVVIASFKNVSKEIIESIYKEVVGSKTIA